MSEVIGIVWNPSKTDKPTLERAIDSALGSASGQTDPSAARVLWFETSPEDPGAGATAEALHAGCTVVVAAGGDGTVRAVAGALGGASPSGAPNGQTADLGIVPLGTGNLLARNLGVPLGSPRKAFERVLAETPAPLDLGTLTLTFADGSEAHEPFVVMAGFGIDAHMIVETDDELKARAGWLAYVESLGRAASETEVVDFELALDGGAADRESAHTLLVANCGMLQGGVTLVPDAAPDDGTLDLLVLRADSAAAWMDTMRNMVWDNGLKRLFTRSDRAESSASTGHLRAERVAVRLPSPHAFEVDGDDFENVTAFEATLQPGALRVR